MNAAHFTNENEVTKLPYEQQLNEYYRYCMYRKRMTETTMKSKQQAINKFLRENPGITDMADITNEMYDAWCDRLIEEGKRGKTVNNYADHVKSCLRYLQNKKQYCIKLDLERVDRFEEEEVKLPAFTKEEIEAIKAQCAGLRELLLISLIFDSWLRIHEIAKLRVEDVSNLDMYTLGKGRKPRDTFMTPETRKLFDRWLVLMDVHEGYVFQSPTDFEKHMSVQQIRNSINSPIRRAGFKIGSAHAIRRGGISQALFNGMSIEDAAIIAGHSDPKVTLQHYYKTNRQRLGVQHAQAYSY